MAARFAVAWVGISLLVLFVAAMPAFSAPVNAASDFTLGGYVQERLNYQRGVDPVTSFTDSRFYISGMATTGTDTKVGFLLTNFDVKNHQAVNGKGGGVLEAFGEKDKGQDTFRMGLYKTTFGGEAGASSSSLTTLERSMVVSKLVYADWSFDNGLFWERTDKDMTIAASVTNGEGMSSKGLPYNSDTNNDKNITAHIGKVKPGKSACGVSALYDKYDDIKVYGVDGSSMGKTVNLMGEALYSQNDGTTSDGFYLTAASSKATMQFKPYARIDWYDPDTSYSGNEYTGITIGASKMLNPLTKETLEFGNGQQKEPQEEAIPASNTPESSQSWKATFQYQTKF